MATWITGAVAATTAVAFLGFLAYKINEWPLWIVIGLAIACLLADYIGTARESQ